MGWGLQSQPRISCTDSSRKKPHISQTESEGIREGGIEGGAPCGPRHSRLQRCVERRDSLATQLSSHGARSLTSSTASSPDRASVPSFLLPETVGGPAEPTSQTSKRRPGEQGRRGPPPPAHTTGGNRKLLQTARTRQNRTLGAPGWGRPTSAPPQPSASGGGCVNLLRWAGVEGEGVDGKDGERH